MAKIDRNAALAEESPRPRRSKTGRANRFTKTATLLAALAVTPTAMAQSCISLKDSKMCPAWNTSSITTTGQALNIFPFLAFVKDTASFDQQMNSYLKTSWAERQYLNRFKCSGIDLTNTTDLYARFSASVLCNVIVQTSRSPCGLKDEESRPLCSDSCAQYAQSEYRIVENPDICENPQADTGREIRADLADCQTPVKALNSGECVNAIENEQANCGFGDSKIGLCGYCGAGGMNSTDTCCYFSGAETLCAGVKLPSIAPSMALPTGSETPSASTTAVSAEGDPKKGLSGGAIAGIVIGSIAGLALLVGLIFLLLFCLRRRRPASKDGSVFNQPSPVRKGPGMAQNDGMSQAPPGFEVLPGGRIARMSALEGHSGDSPPRGGSSGMGGAATGAGYGAAAGYGAGYAGARNRHGGSSSSSFGDSPQSDHRGGILRPPPTGRRQGSLSSNSALGDNFDPNSPVSSGNGMSSPNVNSQQSEQLPYFKDYYSQDEIHPGDKVATLWAYQPRAGDEFMLERGDMLKVVGIWDDGWATGVMIPEKAEDWAHNAQRDSGVSNTSGLRNQNEVPTTGEIKAFPLVCVCLPQHWQKTIEGDGSTETNSSGMANPP